MNKLYYTIGEVSKLTGVEPHVLRYWETLFPELTPVKNRAGKRVYKDRDIQVVLTLRELIQKKKYSTAGARKVLQEQKKQSRIGKDKKDTVQLPHDVEQDLSRVRLFLTDLLNRL